MCLLGYTHEDRAAQDSLSFVINASNVLWQVTHTYSELRERRPWKASGAISEIWLLLRSLWVVGGKWERSQKTSKHRQSMSDLTLTCPPSLILPQDSSTSGTSATHDWLPHRQDTVSTYSNWHQIDLPLADEGASVVVPAYAAYVAAWTL